MTHSQRCGYTRPDRKPTIQIKRLCRLRDASHGDRHMYGNVYPLLPCDQDTLCIASMPESL